MAKNQGGFEDRAKVTFRVIEFELEGGNAAVDNSVRNLTNVIMQRNGSKSPAPIKPALRGNGAGAAALPAAPAVPDATEDTEQVEDQPDAERVVIDSALSAPRSRAPRKPPVPEVIEIDLTGGAMPFAKFCEGKNLENDWKKYLVCAMWLKEYRDSPTVTDDHIYTMLKFMKWTIPADVAGPLRSMKKHGWFTTPERGKYAINHLGENEVNQMAA